MSRIQRHWVPSVLGALLLGWSCWTPTASAGPVNYTFTESTKQFTYTITGGDFDSDETHADARGVDWSITTNVTEDAGFVNDVLSINWTAQHLIPPDGEGPNVNIFSDGFIVDADDFTPGVHTVTKGINQPIDLPHVGNGFKHVDRFTAKLTFTVETTLNFDDITGYTFVLTGQHLAVPEPGTLAMGLVGLGAVAGYGWRTSRSARRGR
ncbi:PEP-CTERM sorting domain-containing protein [Planctomyces sp. SH-PL62]|uniref:PEP-CTERM sorting domain-containing protein n=1 Tax=Planctomyces sp. SH-PL62 TaxID=1636152 RepID=UPI00078C7B9E|nr:PEP-CTERM sorting domain-containing protein [Planctomyces sp. SH-PL62]AMV38113.1 hypothetical protein VT85_11795 [Planctomyces sp. SH-PL62]